MDWGTFFTILVQVLIVVLLSYIVYGAFLGLQEDRRKNKREDNGD